MIQEEVKKQQPIIDNSRFFFDNVTGIPMSVKDAGALEKEAINVRAGRFKKTKLVE